MVYIWRTNNHTLTYYHSFGILYYSTGYNKMSFNLNNNVTKRILCLQLQIRGDVDV